jgi:hypothetical protein
MQGVRMFPSRHRPDLATPWTGIADGPGRRNSRERRWAVVARPNDDGVVREAGRGERVEDAPDIEVVLDQTVAAARRLALEIWMRERGMVGKGKRNVEEEGPVAPGVSADKIHGAIGHHAVDLPAHVLVVDVKIGRLLAFPCFADVVDVPKRHAGLARPIDDVGGLETKPLVKTLVGRQPSLPCAQMPFAEHRRAIAGFAEHLRNRDLPRVQSTWRAGRNRFTDARTNRQAPGHERGATGCALVFDIEVR